MVNLLSRFFYNVKNIICPYLFYRSYCASNICVLKEVPKCNIKLIDSPNNFIKKMNSVHPQLTGYIVERIYSFVLMNPSLDTTKILDDICIYSNRPKFDELYKIIMNNIDEYVSFCHYVYDNKFINDFICIQDNLTFKINNKCKNKEYKCFADIICRDEIVDIKVVKSPFINKKGNVNNIGAKYYNQLMIYAYGFKRKYEYYPKQIKIINFYQNNIITWKPQEFEIIDFIKLL